MNLIFNILQKSSLILSVSFLSASFIAPTYALARDNSTPAEHTSSSQASRDSNFCAKLGAKTDELTANVTNIRTKLAKSRIDQDYKFSRMLAKTDQSIASSRAKWDAQRLVNFRKLDLKATSDTKKSAVTAYEDAIITAVDKRRLSNGAVRTNYRLAFRDVVAKQRAAVDTNVTTLEVGIAAAETTAVGQCQSHPEKSSAIRSSFITSIKNAVAKFKVSNDTSKNAGIQISHLGQTRDASFKSNEAAFKHSAKAAKTGLQAAFNGSEI